jgi:hypothetical protein
MTLRDDIESAVDELTVLFNEMQHANDRVAAISCAAWLDDMLSAAISVKFIRLGVDWKERVFDSAVAPLSSLHAKITIGYAMGLYGPLARADLDIIRSVRNKFAHRANPISFNDQNISKKCLTLRYSRLPSEGILGWVGDDASPREHYIHASLKLASRLLIPARASRILARPKPPDALP